MPEELRNLSTVWFCTWQKHQMLPISILKWLTLKKVRWTLTLKGIRSRNVFICFWGCVQVSFQVWERLYHIRTQQLGSCRGSLVLEQLWCCSSEQLWPQIAKNLYSHLTNGVLAQLWKEIITRFLKIHFSKSK